MEAIQTRTRGYLPSIQKGACLSSIQLTLDAPILHHHVGKVRDVYHLENVVLLLTTDRQSAFDRYLADIPYKGQVLNLTAAWWFEKTKHIIPNHVVAVPNAVTLIGRKCTIFPIEFVVRGYITGSTNTSMWTHYEKGVRKYCGHVLPDGYVKNQRLPTTLVTPTTKNDVHDELISGDDIVKQAIMTREEYDYCATKALEVFAFGQQEAATRGLLLVDTKYEFGRASDGTILLVDEMHTPDSSRYWLSESYPSRMESGENPENIDKEFLRLWFKEKCDPYSDATLPQAPEELVHELSRRYILLYEAITGKQFTFSAETEMTEDFLNSSINEALATLKNTL